MDPLEIGLQCVGTISMISCLSVILTMVLFQDLLKVKFMRLICMVTICDFFASLGDTFGFQHNSDPLCNVQGFLIMFFYRASFIWLTMFSFQLFWLVKFNKYIFSDLQLHVICWGSSLFFQFIPEIFGAYPGQDDTISGSVPCTFASGTSTVGLLIGFAFFRLLILFLIIINIILSISTLYITSSSSSLSFSFFNNNHGNNTSSSLNPIHSSSLPPPPSSLSLSSSTHSFSSSSPTTLTPPSRPMLTRRRSSSSSSFHRLLFYPFLAALCWIPHIVISLITDLMNFEIIPPQSIFTENLSLFDFLFICATMTGIFNSILFFYNSRTIRKRWWKIFNKYCPFLSSLLSRCCSFSFSSSSSTSSKTNKNSPSPSTPTSASSSSSSRLTFELTITPTLTPPPTSTSIHPPPPPIKKQNVGGKKETKIETENKEEEIEEGRIINLEDGRGEREKIRGEKIRGEKTNENTKEELEEVVEEKTNEEEEEEEEEEDDDDDEEEFNQFGISL